MIRTQKRLIVITASGSSNAQPDYNLGVKLFITCQVEESENDLPAN